jgi:MFS family permease
MTSAGELLALMSGSALVAKLVSGLVVDRVGNRIPLVATALSCASGMGLLSLPVHGISIILSLILVGFSGATWTLLASATAAEFGAEGFGRAFGLISALTPIGVLAPPVLAKIEEYSGSYAPGLDGLAALAVFGAGLALLLKEKPRQAREELLAASGGGPK